jgi:3-deoxy-D-manno-octulosonic-acid transferase
MSRARLAYTCLLYLLLPFLPLRLLLRGRKQPAYLEHWSERFGHYAIRPNKPVIWLHAVSVGETRAAVPLVQQLLEHYPNHQILLTHMTPTGRETSTALFGSQVLRYYLPYDYPFAVRRFLHHFKPVIGLLMETEIWPNLVHASKRTGIPVLLVNARLSQRSASKYAKFSQLARESLRNLSAIAAQTEEDVRRFNALGECPASVMGNLKFDVTPSASLIALGGIFRERFGHNRPVFLAASTREGEEALLLDALRQESIPSLLTVIVPRHPQRFGEVAELLVKRHIPFQRRSENQPIEPETEVVLGDSMGEMFAYYAAADIAFIGGSLLPYGGQNLIEACAVGTPVLIGPHTYNFSMAVDEAVKAGAAKRVTDAADLAHTLGTLLRDEIQRQAMRAAGLEFSRQHAGATLRLMKMISTYLG